MNGRGLLRLVGVALMAVLLACAGGPVPRAFWRVPRLALVGGTVWTSPTEPPLRDGVVVIAGEHIAAVGRRGEVRIPEDAAVIDCAGTTVTAGFWNSHVHFTEPRWLDASARPAEQLEQNLQRMLTRHGFVRVVDTGSWLENTIALRHRIEEGGVPGPAILTTGLPFVPENGTPMYSPIPLPELANALRARREVQERIESGADAIKLFTGTVQPHGKVPLMRLDVVKAAVAEAHARGKLVLAHPTNQRGVELAVEGGVDVLLHTAPKGGPWPPELIQAMQRAQVALVPTLMLWEHELRKEDASPDFTAVFVETAVGQLKAYAEAGGTVLFGTDVGYMDEDEPGHEYELMVRAGMDFRQILASLTTAPAAKFGVAGRTGRVAEGLDADLVVLDGDPTVFLGALDHVRYAMRAGKFVYRAPEWRAE